MMTLLILKKILFVTIFDVVVSNFFVFAPINVS